MSSVKPRASATASSSGSMRQTRVVTGQITMSGTGAELLANPDVKAAYLEGGAH